MWKQIGENINNFENTTAVLNLFDTLCHKDPTFCFLWQFVGDFNP